MYCVLYFFIHALLIHVVIYFYIIIKSSSTALLTSIVVLVPMILYRVIYNATQYKPIDIGTRFLTKDIVLNGFPIMFNNFMVTDFYHINFIYRIYRRLQRIF